MTIPIELSKNIAKARTFYNEKKSDKQNWLTYGPVGSGKSFALRTARLPILAVSFDPGGLQCLEELQASGNAIIETETEREDWKKPTCFEAFDRIWTSYKTVFPFFGTVAIDSLTGLADSLMNWIIKKDGRAAQTPQIQDYYKLQMMMMDVMRDGCNLPCDFIVNAHIGTEKDEVTGKILTALMVSGKSAVKVPILFDQVLVSQVRADNKTGSIAYGCLTRNDGFYQARMRLAANNQYELFEPLDYMQLRAKGGKSCEHLPPLNIS